jgi:polyhydroxybutyrate depolymerase
MPRRHGRRTPGFVVAALVVALLAGCGAGASTPSASPDPTPAPASGLPNGRGSITVDGVERTFIARAPQTAGETTDISAPAVLIALHGLGGEGADFEGYTGLTGAVHTDRVMLVYPDGLPTPDGRRSWNAGGCCNPAGQTPVDDVAFLDALIDRLIADGADPDRIYLAGFSNGGMMAYRAACELGESIAGIAVVAGALVVDDCTPSAVVPLVAVHGTADPVVPFDGGPLSPEVQASLGRADFPSVAQSVEAWRDRNECDADAEPSVSGDVTTTRYTECSAGGAITVITVAGNGHTWATADGTFDATPVIRDAFGL